MKIFAFGCSFNNIFIFENLGPTEIKTGQGLFDFLKKEFSGSGFGINYFKIENRNQLIEKFYWIILLAIQNPDRFFPMLHFDIHGDENGLVLNQHCNTEEVSYEELDYFFRIINFETKNNLAVFLSTCYGFRSIMSAPINLPVPFYLLIGPEAPIKTGFILENVPKFYSAFFSTFNLNLALCKIKPNFNVFNSEHMFVRSIINYFNNHCNFDAKEQRVQRILKRFNAQEDLSYEMEEEIYHTGINMMDPNEETFEKFKKVYLMTELKPDRRYPMFQEISHLIKKA